MNDVLPWLPVAVVLSGLVAGAVLWGLVRLAGPPQAAPGHGGGVGANNFLFRDGALVDHDAAPAAEMTDWPNLRHWLAARFGNLPAQLPALGRGEARRFPAADPGDPAYVEIAAVPGGHRVTLADPGPHDPAAWHDTQTRLAAADVYRAAAETAPCAIAILDADGGMGWSNTRFRAFSDEEAAQILDLAPEEGAERAPLALGDGTAGRERYFDLAVTNGGDCRILHASDVTRLVRADTMRSSFIQTLTKTFADLATGLAVFDRDHRLVLFNPAMIDLTGLPAEFLSARPGLLEFFDRLRDRQVLPEPKNYANRRAQINEMIKTAAGGRYAEAWTLPDGLTYRVTGRPHPDGAIAFLIEDISDEVSLTRRSRMQLEIRQAALDRVDDAVAVIGPTGLMVLCNRACRELLGFDPDSSFAETSLDDLLRLCHAHFPAERFWQDVAAGAGRARAEGKLEGPDGPARARIEPLPGGFAMLSLSTAVTASPVTA